MMTRTLAALVFLFSVGPVFAAPDGGWLKQVPAQARTRPNPYAQNTDAVAAGALLFKRSCASCHGADAGGRGKRPSLRTARVHDASDGELFWLLTNGSLAHGMPSWSRLPEEQRWQLTRYLHSLPLDEGKQAESVSR